MPNHTVNANAMGAYRKQAKNVSERMQLADEQTQRMHGKRENVIRRKEDKLKLL